MEEYTLEMGELIEYTPEMGESMWKTSEFLTAIKNELKSGYGFIPFIGAGFSAPSGAPLIFEVEEYLQKCICISLGIDGAWIVDGSDFEDIEPWNPRTDQWPPLIDRSRSYKWGHWPEVMYQHITHIRMRLEAIPPEEKAKHRETSGHLKILIEGLGAMQEWRGALHFLSRVTRAPRSKNKDSKQVRLGVPSTDVVDACFRHVLKDKHPGLEQRMLAVLSSAMRMDTILTINFDNLIEQAFEQMRNTLQVFEVPTEGNLPSWNAICNDRSIVKLHGGKTSLKVDYSLDEEPTQEDKKTFARYLIGNKSCDDIDAKDNWDFQSHLFVSGFSGSDRRINAMIKYALSKLKKGDKRDSGFKIFWVCHSKKDHDLARAFAKECSAEDQFKIIRYPSVGSLLLHLYQDIENIIPPVGGIFPSISRTSTPPIEPSKVILELNKYPDSVKKFLEDATAMIEKRESPSAFHTAIASPGILLAIPRKIESLDPTAPPKFVSGITSVCARLYRRLEQNRNCLWFDMNHISSAENFYEVLLESIYFKLGLEDWIPSTVHIGTNPKDEAYWTKQQAEIDRLLRSVNKNWILFLNTYEIPGVNLVSSDYADNWLRHILTEKERHLNPPSSLEGMPSTPDGITQQNLPDRYYSDKSNTPDALFKLLKGLCGRYSRLTVVILTESNPFTLARGVEVDYTRIPQFIQTVTFEGNTSDHVFFNKDEITKSCFHWAGSDTQKLRFLVMLSLMQRPRHHSTIWKVLLDDKNATAVSDVDKQTWVNDLEERMLLRRKPGGLIWLHAPCRQQIRDIFQKNPAGIQLLQKLEISPPNLDRDFLPQQHRRIAEWYEHLLDSSESPQAAFEAAHHFVQAALAYASQPTDTSLSIHPDVFPHPFDQACANLDAACAIIRSNALMIQTKGYSRGSCRRIDTLAIDTFKILTEIQPYIQKALDARLLHAIITLWIVCAETARAIAREVGEDGKAYYRHRQAARLLLLKAKLDNQIEQGILKQVTNEIAQWEWNSNDDFVLTNLSDQIKQAFPNTPEGTHGIPCPAPESIRWHRWSCMLGIASRSFEVSEKIFTDFLGELNIQDPDNPEDDAHRYNFYLPKQRIEILRMIEEWAGLILVREGSLARQKAFYTLNTATITGCKHLIERGLRLATRVRDLDISPDSSATFQANWCETRLLMHKSIALTFCADHSGCPYAEAMGVLNSAEGKLRLSDYRRVKAELALIDLHRSEIKLRQAESLDLNSDKTIGDVAKKLIALCSTFSVGKSIPDVVKLQRKISTCQNQSSTQLQQVSAIVNDAMRFLNRAAPSISQRRRNVWWSTWYFERRIRSIALQVEVALLNNLPIIPFLGLEHAVRNTETEADIILDDAIRMIRVDSYRLASIVEQYHRCFLALNCRLFIEGIQSLAPKTTSATIHLGLPRRRGKMLLKLKQAHTALIEVEKRRNGLSPYQSIATAFMTKAYCDPCVQRYVDKVLIDVNTEVTSRSQELTKYIETLIEEELVVIISKSEKSDVDIVRNYIKSTTLPKVIQEKHIDCHYLAFQLGLTYAEFNSLVSPAIQMIYQSQQQA